MQMVLLQHSTIQVTIIQLLKLFGSHFAAAEFSIAVIAMAVRSPAMALAKFVSYLVATSSAMMKIVIAMLALAFMLLHQLVRALDQAAISLNQLLVTVNTGNLVLK